MRLCLGDMGTLRPLGSIDYSRHSIRALISDLIRILNPEHGHELGSPATLVRQLQLRLYWSIGEVTKENAQ